MARIRFRGLEEYELKLSKLASGTKEVAGKAIYAGAKIITDKIRENIQALPAHPDSYGLIAYRNKWPAPLTDTAKKGLLEGLGITPMEDDNGFYNVKIGFDGYNDLKTRKYPKGQPNQLIARSIESGTSISEKRPFVTPAIRATRKQAEQAMADVIDEETKKIMK